MRPKSKKQREIESYAKVYGINLKLAERVRAARTKWEKRRSLLRKATCRQDVLAVYNAIAKLFFGLCEDDPKVAKLLGRGMASEMFNLSRHMHADRRCIKPEGLSPGLWEIAHREKRKGSLK
jgi:hypothetical protein